MPIDVEMSEKVEKFWVRMKEKEMRTNINQMLEDHLAAD